MGKLNGGQISIETNADWKALLGGTDHGLSQLDGVLLLLLFRRREDVDAEGHKIRHDR